MTARHLWLVDAAGTPDPLLDFLRGCQSAYRNDDTGWSVWDFVQQATYSFDRLVIGEPATVAQLAQLACMIERHKAALRVAKNRLIVIAMIEPPIDAEILAEARFTVQHVTANAVRTKGELHAEGCR
jgi:hypothetical protein